MFLCHCYVFDDISSTYDIELAKSFMLHSLRIIFAKKTWKIEKVVKMAGFFKGLRAFEHFDEISGVCYIIMST